MYELPKTLNISGTEFSIRSDFRAVLDVITALCDPTLNSTEKSYVMLSILYEDYTKIDDLREAVKQGMWFISCGENTTNGHKPKLIDWEQDFKFIVAPVNRILGFECRVCDYLHWWSFISAYYEIGECSLSTIVGIRDKKRKGKKLDKWEKDYYNENRDIIDFKTRLTDEEQAEIEDILG